MSDENKDTEMVTKAELEAIKAELDATKATNEKLAKIFEERQTKALKKEDVLKKDELLKALGIEKDPEKDPVELINEKLSGLGKQIEELTQAATTAKAEAAHAVKRATAEKIAQSLNFIDVDDAVEIAIKSDDIESKLKEIAQAKPHWIKPVNAGGSFQGGATEMKTLQDEWRAAMQAGKAELAISLKNRMSKIS